MKPFALGIQWRGVPSAGSFVTFEGFQVSSAGSFVALDILEHYIAK